MNKTALKELEECLNAYFKDDSEEHIFDMIFQLAVMANCGEELYVPFRLDKEKEKDLYLNPTDEMDVYYYEEGLDYGFYVNDNDEPHLLAVSVDNYDGLFPEQIGYVTMPVDLLLELCKEENMGLGLFTDVRGFMVKDEVMEVLLEDIEEMKKDSETVMEILTFDKYRDDKYNISIVLDKPTKKIIKEIKDIFRNSHRKTYMSLLIPISVMNNYDYMSDLAEVILNHFDPDVYLDIYVRDKQEKDIMENIFDQVAQINGPIKHGNLTY
ncbi:MAG: hypothetical protein Q4D13_06855 [Erysipelotrichaceae bacterium]|nr:hypothetical protein [Erysipelotrichaceae bacterium]